MKPELKKQIQTFLETFNVFEKNWFDYLAKNNVSPINLKRVRVKELAISTTSGLELRNYIYLYRRIVARSNPSAISKILEMNNINRSRIKETLSISKKIDNYIRHEQDSGTYLYVTKCLNDIMGARIIIDLIPDFDALKTEISQEFPMLKVTNASKPTGYKAVHVYTNPLKGHLPWELQIWQACDEQNNIQLHSEYKRDYIKEIQTIKEVSR